MSLIRVTGLICLPVAALGGAVALWLGLRGPWFFGGLVGALALALLLPRDLRIQVRPPVALRQGAIGFLAVVFGAGLSERLSADMLSWWPSLLAVVLVAGMAHWAGYRVYLAGGQPRTTAWFAAMPGGVAEALAQAETHGADKPVVSLMQLVRVGLVLAVLPLAFSLWFALERSGTRPGGINLIGGTGMDALIFLLVAVVSVISARRFRLPGGVLGTAFFNGAVLAGLGLLTPAVPEWAWVLAQIVIATALGTGIAAIDPFKAGPPVRLAALGTLCFFGVALLGSWVLFMLTGLPIWLGVLIMAPAGIAEMSVIALSLGADPVFVLIHHVARVAGVVYLMPVVRRVLSRGVGAGSQNP